MFAHRETVFSAQIFNAEARRTQSFAEFIFLRDPQRPLYLCVNFRSFVCGFALNQNWLALFPVGGHE
jgi:hypothetical protein